MTARRPDKACEQCGEMFHPARKEQRFCSNSCSSKWQYRDLSREALCVQCGETFTARNKGNQQWTKCCSRKCASTLAYRGGNAASRRRRRYGMEPEEYDRLAELGCALCGFTPTNYPLYVDHDHATKKNRGLLCARCNTWVAAFDAMTVEEIHKFWNYTNPNILLIRHPQ